MAPGLLVAVDVDGRPVRRGLGIQISQIGPRPRLYHGTIVSAIYESSNPLEPGEPMLCQMGKHLLHGLFPLPDDH
jgi:hypothetical protein